MKKKLNLFLIIIVALLWGTVLYRYVSNSLPQTPVDENNVFVTKENIVLTLDRDTFLLNKLKYNPFGEISHDQVNSSSSSTVNYLVKHSRQKERKIVPDIVPTDAVPPEIVYFGYIKSENKELAIFSLNGKIKRLAKDQVFEGVVVKRFSKQNLTISYRKNDLIFEKAKND